VRGELEAEGAGCHRGDDELSGGRW
jgi:hypothetical protein